MPQQMRKSRSQRRRDNIVKGDAESEKSVNKIMFIVFAVMLVTFGIVLFIRLYEPPIEVETPGQYVKESTQNVVVEFKVKDKGSFQMELYNDKMPNTVENFVSNVYKKVYVNRKFNREDAYMLVAGGSDDEYDNVSSAELEFEQHEDLVNVGRYSVGMVKHTDSGNNSRVIFMVAKANNENLSGEYSMFGKIKGIASENVLDSIKLDDVIEDCTIISIDGEPFNEKVPVPTLRAEQTKLPETTPAE